MLKKFTFPLLIISFVFLTGCQLTEISVLSFDNTPLAPVVQITLTTILPTQTPFQPVMQSPTHSLVATQEQENEQIITLRSLASQRGVYIGSVASVLALTETNQYRAIITREFNMLTPGTAMKFSQIHPANNRYDFSDADFLMAFALQNNMVVRGHTLVWHNDLPSWLKQGNFKRNEMIAILKEHITTVVGRYRGQIEAWDVVNEAIGSDGKLRDSIWLETIGPDYIDMAFEWAHKADPKAKLFYNDYSNEGKNTKSDAIFKMVKGMVERGVPINGVGLQMHIDLLDPPNWKDVADNMQRLSDFGFEVHITEMDVRIQQPVTENQLTKQANIYYNAMQTCLNATNCKAFVMWGFTDLYSWIPGSFPGYGSALIFDEFFNPKPAYDALMQVLGGG